MHPPDASPLLCLHPQTAANEPLTLLAAPVREVAAEKAEPGTGALVLRWLPSTGLRFEARLSTWGLSLIDRDAPVAFAIGAETVQVLVNRTHLTIKDGCASSAISGSVRNFVKGDGAALAHVGFQVVNFSDFLTPGPRPSFGHPPSTAELLWNDWRIRVSAVERSKDIFNSLEEAGGYAFTHMGRIERVDGAIFAADDAERVLDGLNRFLGFARGAASNLAIRWGVNAVGEIVWERWGSPVVDPWKGRDNWFDEHHGNLLAEIFPAFADAHADPERWEALSLALHWYQKSNTRAGGMEGAIILGLTSLELLGALIVVDKTSTLTESQYESFNAVKKLRSLLDVLRVEPVFPERSKNLAAFANRQGWPDTAKALVELRHGYVHANKGRRKIVLSASNLATFEAWQLSLWYQELALLYLLDHRGECRNRMVAGWVGEVERVPWSK